MQAIWSGQAVSEDCGIMGRSFPTSKHICEFHVEIHSGKDILARVVLSPLYAAYSALGTLAIT